MSGFILSEKRFHFFFFGETRRDRDQHPPLIRSANYFCLTAAMEEVERPMDHFFERARSIKQTHTMADKMQLSALSPQQLQASPPPPSPQLSSGNPADHPP
jgi:hypothetical protein